MSLTKLKNIITLITLITPSLWDIVKAVEEQLPESSGAQKLKAVLEQIKAIVDTLAGLGVVFDDVKPQLTVIITSIVTALNAAGIFKRKAGGAGGAGTVGN